MPQFLPYLSPKAAVTQKMYAAQQNIPAEGVNRWRWRRWRHVGGGAAGLSPGTTEPKCFCIASGSVWRRCAKPCLRWARQASTQSRNGVTTMGIQASVAQERERPAEHRLHTRLLEGQTSALRLLAARDCRDAGLQFNS